MIKAPNGDDNPYRAPESDDANPPVQLEVRTEEAERIRSEYLDHETLVHSAGNLYVIVGTLALLAVACVAAVMFLQSTGQLPNRYQGHEATVGIMIGVMANYVILCIPTLWIGYGLRTLRDWARFPAGIYPIPFLFSYPLMLLIAAPTLFFVFSKKSKYVCTAEYHAVIQATPHIRYRMSVVIKVLIWLFLGLIALGVIAKVFGDVQTERQSETNTQSQIGSTPIQSTLS